MKALVGTFNQEKALVGAFSKDYVQSVPKKMSFSGKTAITAFKLIQDARVGGVLENSGYLLQHGHQDFQN